MQKEGIYVLRMFELNVTTEVAGILILYIVRKQLLTTKCFATQTVSSGGRRGAYEPCEQSPSGPEVFAQKT